MNNQIVKKKLFTNIDLVNIKGNEKELSKIVTDMDKRLQEFSQQTTHLRDTIRKFSNNNEGSQYMKMLDASKKMSQLLYCKSWEFNNYQHEVVAYQNKNAIFNDHKEVDVNPFKPTIEEINLNLSEANTKFSYQEMVQMKRELDEYSKSGHSTIQKLNSNLADAGRIWNDPQYKNLVSAVEETNKCILAGLKVFEAYAQYLQNKIVKLNVR